MLLAATFAVNSAMNFILGLLVARFLGPEQFGLYALGAALMMLVNAFAIDWLKLSTIRFYTEGTRSSHPGIRSTLDGMAALCTLSLLAILFAAIVSGADLRIPTAIVMAAVAAGAAGGLFDYQQAVARAREADMAYARMVFIKNALALLLMVGGAWATQSPALVLGGATLSSLVALMTARRALADSPLRLRDIDPAQVRIFAAYAFPLIAGNVILTTIPLLNRGQMAAMHGLAEAGYFSLASEIGMKALATVSATLEILLLPLAVKALEREGMEAAHRRIGRNLVVILAVIGPVAAGFLAALPAFEKLIVPAAFQGHFSLYSWLLMPAFIALPVAQIGFNQVNLISKRTGVAALAAVAAVALNLILVGLLMAGYGRSLGPEAVALAMSCAFTLYALVIGVGAMRHKAARPGLRDLAAVGLGIGLMLAAIWPMRTWQPAGLALLAQIAVGAAVYGAVMLAADLGGCRGAIRARLARGRPKTAA